MPSAALWMDLEIITLSEVSQKEKDKYHMIPRRSNLKYDTPEKGGIRGLGRRLKRAIYTCRYTHTCILVADSHCCMAETNTTLKATSLQLKFFKLNNK